MFDVFPGDVLVRCNDYKNNSIFWKKSKYILVESKNNGKTSLMNNEGERKVLSDTFINQLMSNGLLRKVDSDDEKAKYFLTGFEGDKDSGIIVEV